jgi:hypothetical protein
MYYKFLDSVDSKEIGYHPQLRDTWPDAIDFWAPNSFANAPIEGLVESTLVFPKFELKKRAHLTDRLSTGCLPDDFFVVSGKLLGVLQQHTLDQYQQFSIEIGTQNGIAVYKILYFPFPKDNDFINWEESTFIRELPDGKLRPEKFNSARAYNLAKDNHQLRPDNLLFKEGQLEQYDMFKFKWIQGGTYVSEKLRQAILDAEITGVRFEAAEWLEHIHTV